MQPHSNESAPLRIVEPRSLKRTATALPSSTYRPASRDSPEPVDVGQPDSRAISYLSGRGPSQTTSLQLAENRIPGGGASSAIVASTAEGPQQRLGSEELGGAELEQRLASEVVAGIWTYERVAAVPEFAAAFEEFARKALCQESVLFLQEVTR